MSNDDRDKSRRAVELGRQGGRKGGKARAAALGPDGLAAASKKMLAGRWVPKATHVGILPIVGMSIPCANLDNSMRVLSQRGFYAAIGGGASIKGPAGRDSDVPGFLAAKNLQPFISDELRAMASTLIKFRFVHTSEDGAKSAHVAHGIDARLIPEICEVFLAARDKDELHHTQHNIAKAAEVLMRALARVGIIALVDEATGYQFDRDREELARIVDAYVSEEWRKWTRTFPHEFFKQIHRIQGWSYVDKQTTHPQYVGKLINEYIYERLPDGVLERLRLHNPVGPNGRRARKHTQHMSADTGIPHLDKQIDAVTTLLAVSDDKVMFEDLLKKRFPKSGDQLSLLPTQRPKTAPEVSAEDF